MPRSVKLSGLSFFDDLNDKASAISSFAAEAQNRNEGIASHLGCTHKSANCHFINGLPLTSEPPDSTIHGLKAFVSSNSGLLLICHGNFIVTGFGDTEGVYVFA